MNKAPKLRFKEFSGEWEEKKLGEITTLTAGGTPSTSKKEYWNGSIKWMSSGELNLKFIYDVQGRITDLGLKNSSTKIIPKECILIGLAGQGKTRGTVAINFVELCTNQSIASIFPNFDYFKPMFLYYNLDNRYEELRNLSTGSGGRGGLNLNILKNISSFFPNLNEQEKIANFLSSVDKKISITEEKLDLFKEYKKGMMQKIFKQEIRFKDSNGNDYPEWEEKIFKNIFKINQGLQIAISERFLEPSINRMFYITNEFLRKDSKIKYYIENPPENVICNKEDILMTRTGNTGEVVTDIDGAFHNNFFKINYDKNNFNKKFICYVLKSSKIQNIILKFAGASTIPDLNHSDFYKIKSKFPCLEEQEKIAKFLSSIDNKIENLSNKLENLKLFKKGLLQQIFV